MDHHRAHVTERVLKEFEKARTFVVKLPKNLTSLTVCVFAE